MQRFALFPAIKRSGVGAEHRPRIFFKDRWLDALNTPEESMTRKAKAIVGRPLDGVGPQPESGGGNPEKRRWRDAGATGAPLQEFRGCMPECVD